MSDWCKVELCIGLVNVFNVLEILGPPIVDSHAKQVYVGMFPNREYIM